MADDIDKALGKSSFELELKGKTYRVRPLKVGDYTELRRWIRQQRLEDFIRSCAGLPEECKLPSEERLAVITKLSGESIGEADLIAEQMTPMGSLFMLWLMFRETDPELKLSEMATLIEGAEVSLEDVQAILGQFSSPDEINADPTPEQATDSAGTTASACSVDSTATPTTK